MRDLSLYWLVCHWESTDQLQCLQRLCCWTSVMLPVLCTVQSSVMWRSHLELVDHACRLAVDPHDDPSMMPVINKPPRGLGLAFQRNLCATQDNMPPLAAHPTRAPSLYEAALYMLSPGNHHMYHQAMLPSHRQGLQGFVDLISQLRTAVMTCTPQQAVEYMLVKTGYIDWVMSRRGGHAGRQQGQDMMDAQEVCMAAGTHMFCLCTSSSVVYADAGFCLHDGHLLPA